MPTPTTEELLTSINNSVTELQNAAASVAAAAHFHETANTMVADAVEQIEEARDIAMDEVAQEAHGFPIGTIADVPKKAYGNVFMDCDGSVLRKEDYGLLSNLLEDIPDAFDRFGGGTQRTEGVRDFTAINYIDHCACYLGASVYPSNDAGLYYTENYKDWYKYNLTSEAVSYSSILALFKKYVVLSYKTSSSGTASFALGILNDDMTVTIKTLRTSTNAGAYIFNIIDNIFYAAFYNNASGSQGWEFVSINLLTGLQLQYTLSGTTYGTQVIANFVKVNNRVLLRLRNALVYTDNDGRDWSVWEYSNVGNPLTNDTNARTITASSLGIMRFDGNYGLNFCFCKTENDVLFENNSSSNYFLYSTDYGTTWNPSAKPWSANGRFDKVFYKNGYYYFITNLDSSISIYKTTDFVTWDKIYTINEYTPAHTRYYELNGIVYVGYNTSMYGKFYTLLNINNGKLFTSEDLDQYFENRNINSVFYIPHVSLFINEEASGNVYNFLKIDPNTFDVIYSFDNHGCTGTNTDAMVKVLITDDFNEMYRYNSSNAFKHSLYSYDRETEIKLPVVYSRSYLQKHSNTEPLANPLTGKYAAIRVR